jgi:hypothetical protein
MGLSSTSITLMLLGMKPISSVVSQFKKLTHDQHQRLAIRSRIAGL